MRLFLKEDASSLSVSEFSDSTTQNGWEVSTSVPIVATSPSSLSLSSFIISFVQARGSFKPLGATGSFWFLLWQISLSFPFCVIFRDCVFYRLFFSSKFYLRHVCQLKFVFASVC